SSRRRHTRFSRDWSSDVCSSDLDAEGITLTGDWEKFRGGYGPNQLLAKPSDEIISAQFTPEIPEDGEYEIFVFMTKNARRTSETEYTVFDGADKCTGFRNEIDQRD